MPPCYYKLTVNFPTLKSLFFQLWFNLFASKGQLNASQRVTLTILLIAPQLRGSKIYYCWLADFVLSLARSKLLQMMHTLPLSPPGNQWVFCVQINFYRAITFNPRCNFPAAQLNNFLFRKERPELRQIIYSSGRKHFFPLREKWMRVKVGKCIKCEKSYSF